MLHYTGGRYLVLHLGADIAALHWGQVSGISPRSGHCCRYTGGRYLVLHLGVDIAVSTVGGRGRYLVVHLGADIAVACSHIHLLGTDVSLDHHISCTCAGFVSDIAIFVLKRDVKLQLTN